MKKILSMILTFTFVFSMVLGTNVFADSVDYAVVDLTTPTDSVILADSGTSRISIIITISGKQDGTSTFKIYKDWMLTNGIFTGSNPETFTIAPRTSTTAVTYKRTGTLTVSGTQPEGTFTLAAKAFDITNTNQTGAKLSAGLASDYDVTVDNPDVIIDTAPPVFTVLPSAKTIEAKAVDTLKADINFGTVTTTDASGCTVTNNAPETFPIGSTTVTWTATDENGLTSTAEQVITIIDTTVPVFTVLPSHKTFEATAVNTPKTDIDFGIVEATDIFDATVTNNAPEAFPLGTTPVTWTATDGNGLTNTVTQLITIVDTTVPEITASASFSKEATDVITPVTAAELGIATVSDIFVPVNITNNAPAAFPYGSTTVTWTASDANGLSNTATQEITIIDTTVPVFTVLPLDKKFEATAVNTPKTDIDLGTVTATDIFGATVTNNAPETFPMGETTVTWTATDGNGLTSTSEQVITIVDTTVPVFTFVPSAKTVKATGITTTVEIGIATATDIFEVKIVNNAPAVFPIGKTIITWTATDGHGLVSTATQVITVEYDFKGFFQPVDMGGVINTVKAGSSIPVKFSLGGNMGLNIFANTPKAIALIVNPLDPSSDIETVTAGNSGLSYDPISKQYTYVWKTDKSWVGLSKQLVIKFIDGTEYTANFKFK